MKINESFKDFIFDYKTKLYILKGGAGAGKSHSITQKLIIKGLQSPRRILVMRATQVSLRDSCISLFKAILEEEGIPYVYRSLAGEIQFGQSIVLFKGGDNPERLLSLHNPSDIWIEEASEVNPDIFKQLCLRLRSNVADLQIMLSFNPISIQSWLYRYFFDKESPEFFLDGWDYKIIESTYKDNAFLPATYIQTLLSLKKSDPMYYAVYVLNQWGTTGKLVFPYGTYNIKHIEIPTRAKRIYGCDPGVMDKFAIECSAHWVQDGKHILYTYNEFCKSEVLNKEVSEWIKENISSSAIVHTDCAGASQIRELQSLGNYNIKKNSKPPGHILATIDKIKSFDEWIVDPSCVYLVKDLSLYSWHKDKASGLYTMDIERVVDGYHCDAIDAVRYSMDSISAEATVSKIKLYKGI